MEVHILIPPNGKNGIEIRVVGMDDGQDVKVTEQKFYTAAAEKELIEKEKAEKPVREPRWEGEDNTICQYCGKALFNARTGRKKRFCDKECRRKWWNENRDKAKPGADAIYTFVCFNCGKEFTSYGNPNRKYCSHECFVRARYYNGEELVTDPEEPDYSVSPTITLL